MIRNMVFDMGRVMLQFDPSYIAGHFVAETDVEQFAEKVFFSACWDSLDRGTITIPQAREVIRRTLPERLLPHLDQALQKWYHFVLPVEGMEQVIRELKSAGYSIFLLTNANEQFKLYQETVPAWDCFNGLLVSSDYKLLKPEPAIYRALAEKYGLSLPECLFIDDREENVAGAQAVGMEAIQFTNPSALRHALAEMGLLPE